MHVIYDGVWGSSTRVSGTSCYHGCFYDMCYYFSSIDTKDIVDNRPVMNLAVFFVIKS